MRTCAAAAATASCCSAWAAMALISGATSAKIPRCRFPITSRHRHSDSCTVIGRSSTTGSLMRAAPRDPDCRAEIACSRDRLSLVGATQPFELAGRHESTPTALHSLQLTGRNEPVKRRARQAAQRLTLGNAVREPGDRQCDWNGLSFHGMSAWRSCQREADDSALGGAHRASNAQKIHCSIG
jgi:hypothetical protein